MGKSDDYLDQLLKEVGGDELDADFGADLDAELMGADLLDDVFFDGDASDDILKDFELEMSKSDGRRKVEDVSAANTDVDIVNDNASESAKMLFDDLDDILNGAAGSSEFDDLKAGLGDVPAGETPFTESMPVEEAPIPLEMPQEVVEPEFESEVDLLDLLGEDLPSQEEESASESVEVPVEEPEDSKGKKKKKKEKKKEDGFFHKLGLILFGEDDEDDDKKIIIGDEFGDVGEFGEIAIDELSANDANAELLKQFGVTEGPADKKDKGKKKKDKKEKKEKKKKEKKEKPKKEKKPKPKKEKKPKPPKEPDNSPPLPKKPVFLTFLMAGSLLGLILLGTNLMGYRNQMANAEEAYAAQSYSKAFAYVSGIEVKEEDLELYNKYHIMALVSSEYEAYETFMQAEFYDMALDCLVRTIGRYEKYKADAELYGCLEELNALALEAENALLTTFYVTREQAVTYYNYQYRQDYSIQLQKVLREAGLEKVTER